MTDNISVLVTGSDGFVGRHLVPYLAQHRLRVIAASRSATSGDNINVVPLPDLSKPVDWAPMLESCDSVVHLAGIAHTHAAETLYVVVNHRATEALANAAARLGKHLVFISSIAAQSGSYADRELREDDPPQPTNAYGRSKLAAEHAIRNAGGSFTILRPVVIYGNGEKGNLATIRRLAHLPMPLPFGGLKAQRSVLSVQNLSSAIAIALLDPRARQQTFIVSDPRPVTVADLIAHYRAGLGRPARLFTVPSALFEIALRATGKASVWQRVGRPLVAPPNKLLALGWSPLELLTPLNSRTH